MRAELEFRRPSGQFWLNIENDTDEAAELHGVECLVSWQGLQKPGIPLALCRSFKSREKFPCEVRWHILTSIQEAFPNAPDGDEFEIMVQLLADEGAVRSTSYRVRLKHGQLSM